MGNKASNEATKLKININAKPLCSSQFIHQKLTLSAISSEKTHSPTSPLPTLTARLSTPKPITPDSIAIVSSYPDTPTFKTNPRKDTSFCDVHNGITGTHISSRICDIAAQFWQKTIETASTKEKLEIACTIFFGAFSSNKEMKQVMTQNMNQNKKPQSMEQTSLQYLDMIGWLLRHLVKNNIDLYSLLTRLGTVHQTMGVKINHFDAFLQAMHEALSHYFPTKYNIEVKYAMDEIFSLAAQIMTGEELQYSSHLNNITKTFENPNDIDFLQNLEICLKSTVGREYLYRYLQQTFCDELPLFLQTMCKFKNQLNAIQRFFIARDIIKVSIKPDANFTLNLSYECRKNTLHTMQELELQFSSQQQLNINANFFDQVEQEIYKLILENHWKKFVNNIKALHSKSFGL